MRYFIAVVLFLVAGASAQELVAVVPLPDSIIGLKDPCCVVVAESGRKVIVAGSEPWAIAIDSDSAAKSARVALDPGAVALAANGRGNRVYCAHSRPYPYEDSVVTVLDPATMSVRSRVIVGKSPVAIAWNEQLGRTYVANSGSSSVSVICGQGDTLIGTWPTRPSPAGIIGSKDRLYVWHKLDRWLTVLDASTGALVDTLDIGRYPSDCALSADERRLYVAYGTKLCVIDCSTHARLADLYVGRYPIDLCLDRVSNRLFCPLSHSDAVAVIDCGTNSLVSVIGVGDSPQHLGLEPAGRRIVCSNYWGASVSLIDPDSLRVTGTLATRRQPGLIVTTGGKAYVVHEDNSAVSVIDPTEPSLERSLMLFEEPSILAWNAASERLFCLTKQERIYALDLFDRVVLDLDAGPQPTGLVCDRVEPKFYVSHYLDSSVTVHDARTGAQLKRIKVGLHPSCLGFNSVNRKVYCGREMRLQVIDCATDSVRAGLSNVTRPSAVFYNRRNNKAYVTDAATKSCYVIDGATNGVLGVVRAGEDPTFVGFNPVNNEAYCTFPGSKLAAVISDSTNSISDTLLVPGKPTVLTGVGGDGRIFFGDKSRNVLYAFSSEHELEDSLTGIGNASGLAWIPSPPYPLLCTDAGKDHVLVIDPTTNSVTDTFAVPAGPFSPLVDPGAPYIYVPCGSGSSIAVIVPPVGLAGERGRGFAAMTVNPNPARNRCSLTLSAAPGRTLIELIDPSGRIVRRHELRDGQVQHMILDLSGVPPGVYLVRVTQRGLGTSSKLVVSR